MKKFVVLSAVVCGMAWPVHADIYSQSPADLSVAGISSNYNLYGTTAAADSFKLSASAVITGFKWFGYYSDSGYSPATQVPFGVQLRRGAADHPTSLVHSNYDALADVNPVPVGLTADGLSVYEFSYGGLSIPAAPYSSQWFWLSVLDTDLFATGPWYWSRQSAPSSCSFALVDPTSYTWGPMDQDGNLAFTVEGYAVPVPGAALLAVLGLGYSGWWLRGRRTASVAR